MVVMVILTLGGDPMNDLEDHGLPLVALLPGPWQLAQLAEVGRRTQPPRADRRGDRGTRIGLGEPRCIVNIISTILRTRWIISSARGVPSRMSAVVAAFRTRSSPC